MAPGQFALEPGNAGVGVCQPLLDHERLAVRLNRCQRLPGIAMNVADTVVADGQLALKR